MSEIKFDKYQKKALRLESNVAVSASAGTGKTTILVGCYMRLLGWNPEWEDGEKLGEYRFSPEEIVAITFTEKAAAEMKVRVREAIEERINKSMDNGEREYWEQRRRKLDESSISTFHSFCGKILREHPVEARVDPEFAVLEEDARDDLLRNIVKKVVLNNLSGSNKGMERLIFSIGFGNRGRATGLVDLLVKVITDIRNRNLQIMMDPEKVLHWLQEQVRERERKYREELNVHQEYLNDFYKEIKTEYEQPGFNISGNATREKVENFLSGWERKGKDYSFYADISDEAVKTFEDLKNCFLGGWGAFRRSKELPNDQMEVIINGLHYLQHFPAFEEAHKELISVIVDIIHQFAREKSKLTSLDFDDLQLKVVKLFHEHPQILERYRDSIKYLLVDEYQDTNRVQGILVRALTTGRLDIEGENTSLEGNRLFIVGDKKQSIYRFRGADVTVFDHELKLMKTTLPLKTSYRSRTELLKFFNRFFSKMVMPDEGETPPYEIAYDKSHFLEEHRGSSLDMGVEYLEDDRPDEDKGNVDDLRKEEGKAIAGRISMLLSGNDSLALPLLLDKNDKPKAIEYGDIAILLSALTEVEYIEMALEKSGIPYVTIGGKGFFGTQEVYDLYNFLNYLAYNDMLSLVGILRSPFVGLSDDTVFIIFAQGDKDKSELKPRDLHLFKLENKEVSAEQRSRFTAFRELIEALYKVKNRISIVEIINAILDATGYDATLLSNFRGELRYANIQKFINLARAFERKGTRGLRDFVDNLRNNIETGGSEEKGFYVDENLNAVKIMSIHKAKGLQFPIVFMADTRRQIARGLSPLKYFNDIGLLVNKRIPVGEFGTDLMKSPWCKIKKEQEELEDTAESKRQLYVAATRAKDYLILSGGQTGFSGDTYYKKWLKPFIEQDEGEHIRLVNYSEITEGELIENEMLVLNQAGDLEARPESNIANDIPPNIHRIIKGVPFINPLKVIHLSPTKLLDFEYCERYYYNKNILKLSGIIEYDKSIVINENKLPFSGGNVLEVGNFVHKILELMDFSAPHISDALKLIIDSEKNNYVLEQCTIEEVHRSLGIFLRDGFGDLISESRERYKEFEFWSKLGVMKGLSVFIKGKMDLVFRDAHGNWNIVDYKYGSKNTRDLQRYINQLKLYALILGNLQCCNSSDIKLFLAFLKEPQWEYIWYDILVEHGLDEDKTRKNFLRLGYELGTRLSRHQADVIQWRRVYHRNGDQLEQVDLNPGDCDKRDCEFRNLCWVE